MRIAYFQVRSGHLHTLGIHSRSVAIMFCFGASITPNLGQRHQWTLSKSHMTSTNIKSILTETKISVPLEPTSRSICRPVSYSGGYGLKPRPNDALL
jgi:hypothetical protein